MRSAEPGDMYLHWLDQAVRCEDDGEHRALCRALLESALADLWCVRLGEVHRAFGRMSIMALYASRRVPTNRSERANRRAAIAWINGEPGTAAEPLRWVDVCEALGLDALATRRAVLERLAAPRRDRAIDFVWQPMAVVA